MTTQYSPILKLALPVQGELSGTWGDVVNDNITSMVEQAIAGRAVINTWTTNSHTLTSANGTTSESRCAMLELTDTGTALSGAGTVVCPTASKIYIVKNAAGQNITVKTSGGTGILVPDGRTTFLFCDGTNVVEAMTHTTSLQLGTSTTVTAVLDEDNMASDSATSLATQQSIKAYVDSKVGQFDSLSEVLAVGNTTGSNNIIVDNGQKITTNTIDETTAGSGVTIDSVLLKDDVVNATDVETGSISANDGTTAATIANSTGVVTVPSAVLTTADINGGTADGVVIGGTTPAAATVTTAVANTSLTIAGTTTVTSILDEDNMASDDPAGLATQQSIKAYVDAQVGTVDTLAEVLGNGNTTGGTDIAVSTGDDITFADSSKAIFGAGSDLQIYHDGTGGNSYIDETGSGSLFIRDNDNIALKKQSDNTNMLVARAGAEVELYHKGSEKLATTATGVAITGGATFSGTSNFGDGNELRFGADNDLAIFHSSGVNNIRSDLGTLKLRSDDMRFTAQNGTSEFARFDSSGNFGIGDTNPVNGYLTVRGATTTGTKNGHIMLTGDSATNGQGPQIVFSESGSGSNWVGGTIGFTRTGGSGVGDLLFSTRQAAGDANTTAVEAMRIDSSGDLTVKGGRIFVNESDNGNTAIGLTRDADEGYVQVYSAGAITTSIRGNGDSYFNGGNLIVGGTTDGAASSITLQHDGDIRGVLTSGAGGDSLVSAISGVSNGYQITVDTSNNQTYKWHNGGTQSMTLDASGNLLVGKTTQGLTNAGFEVAPSGQASATQSGASALRLNRLSSDGEILQFRKDSATVGNIGTNTNGNFQLYGAEASHVGLQFGSPSILPINNSGASADNAVDLGDSNVRFKDLYLSNAVVQNGVKATTTATTQVAIETFAHASHDGAKVVITAATSADTYVTELLIATNGTTAVATEYGQIGTGSALATYDVDISGADVRILATPASTTSTTFRVAMTLT
jgi:hypothetical protein